MTQKFTIPPEVVEAAATVLHSICEASLAEVGLTEIPWPNIEDDQRKEQLAEMEAALQAALAKWCEIGKAQSGCGRYSPVNSITGDMVAWGNLSIDVNSQLDFPVLIIRLEGEQS